MAERKCHMCHTVYPESPEFFNRNKNLPSGLNSQCKQCQRDYYYGRRDAVFTMQPRKIFWDQVLLPDYIGTDERWVWQGHINNKGYGSFGANRRGVLSHRHSYELVYGPIPKGLDVMHKCDNPPCCNPAHLSLGTHAENMRDAVEKRRMAYGERSPNAKLTREQVDEIRAKYAAGNTSHSKLAKEYGMAPSGIQSILEFKSWRYK